MSCNASSQASPSDLPGLKHETVQVAVWAWPTMGTTTTPNAFSQSAKVFISAIISRSISSFVFGNFSMSMIYGTFASVLIILMLVQESRDLCPKCFEPDDLDR